MMAKKATVMAVVNQKGGTGNNHNGKPWCWIGNGG